MHHLWEKTPTALVFVRLDADACGRSIVGELLASN